jgi:hypothetical protein
MSTTCTSRTQQAGSLSSYRSNCPCTGLCARWSQRRASPPGASSSPGSQESGISSEATPVKMRRWTAPRRPRTTMGAPRRPARAGVRAPMRGLPATQPTCRDSRETARAVARPPRAAMPKPGPVWMQGRTAAPTRHEADRTHPWRAGPMQRAARAEACPGMNVAELIAAPPTWCLGACFRWDEA